MANLRVDKITSTETFETTGSVQFDGTTDFLSLSSNTDFAMGTGDFTAECWVYVVSDTHVEGGYGQRVFDSNTGQLGIYINSDGTGGYVGALVSGTDIRPTVSHGIAPEGTWTHAAICRSGDDFRIFVNGREAAYRPGTGSVASSADFRIGARASGEGGFKGHISNFRVVKGTALYTENFKPPMRELEVVPGTVLLACQSKTDASLEKTGKTITVNGNAVASELTPGILTPIVKSGGGSAITGSVEFDGTGDYLSLAANSDFNFGSDNFTIEGFFYKGGATTNQTLLCSDKYYIAGNDGNWILRITSGTHIAFASYNGTGSEEYTEFSAKSDDGGWHHFAFVREGTGSNQSKFYFDGVHCGSMTVSKSLTDAGTNGLRIGEESDSGPGNNFMNGFLSNIRINKGTALYTADFIPPTRELKKVPGTVLLCCQDPNNPLTEVTGKTITSYGNLQRTDGPELVTNGYFDNGTTGWSVTGGAIVVTSGQLQLTNSNTTLGKVDQTITTVVGQIYQVSALITPDGGGHFPRLYVGADDFTPVLSSTNIQQLVTVIHTAVSTSTVISLNSNTNNANAVTLFDDVSAYDISYDADAPASNFTPQVGDDRQVTFEGVTKINTDAYFYLPTGNTESRQANGTHNAGTRGVIAGGYRDPAISNIIEYITIASKGNSKDFGDLTSARRGMSGFASNTRGIFAGGNPNSSPNLDNRIDYITIATTGNAKDFGDCVTKTKEGGAAGNQTRGILHAAEGPSSTTATNSLQYVTIQTSGNAIDFGDLTIARTDSSGQASSPTRGIFFGGYFPSSPNRTNTIDYVTIATTSNAIDFGDMIGGGNQGEGNYAVCSNSTRAIRAGGVGLAGNVNRIDYITIATTGDAIDFGDLSAGRAAQGPAGSCASSTRGVIAGGFENPAFLNIIDYVTIQSTGDAQDFGDLIIAGGSGAGVSNGHGGLG